MMSLKAGAPGGPPLIRRSVAGRSRSRPFWPCGTHAHFRCGPVAHTTTSIGLVAPRAITDLALWHSRPDRNWSCGTRGQNGSGLVAPWAGRRRPCGALGRNRVGLVALKARTGRSPKPEGSGLGRLRPASSVERWRSVSLELAGEAAIVSAPLSTQGVFLDCRLVYQL